MQDSSIDFIGIGAPRCGTTWITECLRQHPDVLLPVRQDGLDGELKYRDLLDAKELDFFMDRAPDPHGLRAASNLDKGLDWYLHRFPPTQPGKRRGEFSPDYLRDHLSAELIHTTFPKVRLIVSLRNPIDMVYSLYMLQRYEQKAETLESLLNRWLYLQPGLYAEQLTRYLELFPREQMHIILFEDISDDPERVVKELYDFLGVENTFLPSNIRKKINAAGSVRNEALKTVAVRFARFLVKHGGRSLLRGRVLNYGRLHDAYFKLNVDQRPYAPMRPETRARLQAYFRDDIERLEKLIGRDLSAWKAG